MLSLALETSTRHASAALVKDDAVPSFATLGGERPHLADLMPLVRGLFKQQGVSPLDLTAVFVGTGPGSYTGLRVGISSALGLGIGPMPPKLFGIPSPDALFFEVLEPGESGLWLSDARAGTWYRSRASKHLHKLQIDSQPAIITDDQVEALDRERILTDNASAERLQGILKPGQAARIEFHEPKAGALLALGLLRFEAGLQPTPESELAPLYLRDFAAKVRAR